MRRIHLAFVTVLVAVVPIAQAQQRDGIPAGPGQIQRIGQEAREAVRVRDSIWMAPGFGNTFLITTPDGNVVVDTSMAANAPRHRELLRKVSDAPVRYILLTHAHGDHTGGVATWKEPGTEVIAQREYVEMVHYQTRLRGFFGRRNAAQFQGQVALDRAPAGVAAGNTGAAENYAAQIDATRASSTRSIASSSVASASSSTTRPARPTST